GLSVADGLGNIKSLFLADDAKQQQHLLRSICQMSQTRQVTQSKAVGGSEDVGQQLHQLTTGGAASCPKGGGRQAISTTFNPKNHLQPIRTTIQHAGSTTMPSAAGEPYQHQENQAVQTNGGAQQQNAGGGPSAVASGVTSAVPWLAALQQLAGGAIKSTTVTTSSTTTDSSSISTANEVEQRSLANRNITAAAASQADNLKQVGGTKGASGGGPVPNIGLAGMEIQQVEGG
ncbi:unnamed protein product, partial [Amoebophrya sp. A25]